MIKMKVGREQQLRQVLLLGILLATVQVALGQPSGVSCSDCQEFPYPYVFCNLSGGLSKACTTDPYNVPGMEFIPRCIPATLVTSPLAGPRSIKYRAFTGGDLVTVYDADEFRGWVEYAISGWSDICSSTQHGNCQSCPYIVIFTTNPDDLQFPANRAAETIHAYNRLCSELACDQMATLLNNTTDFTLGTTSGIPIRSFYYERRSTS